MKFSDDSIKQPQGNRTFKLIFCAGGIFACYAYYGLLQEKITRSKYGPDEEKFVYSMCLVLCQCLVNAVLAQILLLTIMRQGKDSTRTSYYASASLTYLTAMVSSNMSLQHVNYPTQVVGKSCKPVPVMVLGVLVGRKRYPVSKYLFVLTIVIGIIFFMYKDKPSNSLASDKPLLGWGEILLLLSLTCDGLLGAIQERMKSDHKTQSCHMMLNLNLWSILYSTLAVLITGEWFQFVSFINRYPYVIYNIFLFTVMSAIGQVFIYLTVADFGPLPCSIITTVRKFFSVIASVFLFGNAITARQWFGSALVFIGLGLDAFYSKSAPRKK